MMSHKLKGEGQLCFRDNLFVKRRAPTTCFATWGITHIQKGCVGCLAQMGESHIRSQEKLCSCVSVKKISFVPV